MPMVALGSFVVSGSIGSVAKGNAMHKLLENLLADGPAITDGAWGTQLQARGLRPGQSPDEWNLLHPEKVLEVARQYVEAGSQVILTNTFRANRIALAATPLAGEIGRLNQAGVEISRRAAAGRAAVFASIGPSGKLLLTGEVQPEELLAAFSEQAEALAEAHADALLIETMADLEEARLALAAAKKTSLPTIVSMVFDSGRNRDRTVMGTTPEQAVKTLADEGADAVGANCGQEIAGYLAICRRMRGATDLPLWMKPNAGQPQIVDEAIVYQADPVDFAAQARALAEAGASFLGGCCGTGPSFVTALREELLQARRTS